MLNDVLLRVVVLNVVMLSVVAPIRMHGSMRTPFTSNNKTLKGKLEVLCFGAIFCFIQILFILNELALGANVIKLFGP
jgi:hypothetical protein